MDFQLFAVESVVALNYCLKEMCFTFLRLNSFLYSFANPCMKSNVLDFNTKGLEFVTLGKDCIQTIISIKFF